MNLNIEDMTIGELILFEEVSGKSMTEIGTSPGAKELQALALVFLRRDNPEATLEDASAVKVSAFSEDAGNPTEATETTAS